MNTLSVAALYRFVAFADFEEWRQPLLDLCVERAVLGTLLLAPEGINGTIAGQRVDVEAVIAFLERDARLTGLDCKWSTAEAPPFRRMKVRLKQEIVTMGVTGIDPNETVGTYVEAADWNRLIEDPEVVLVDTRNDYEVGIGSFKGALNPDLGSFREFPEWLRETFDGLESPKVAMFCTGGIRCEKSTAFLRQAGVSEVYHLKGGILKYLEVVPEEESLWEGECFVFDERVSVVHGLAEGSYEQCRACGFPVNEAGRTSPDYVLGVSCSHCAGLSSAQQKAGFAERARQRLQARDAERPD
ncbi:MAG: UPF0176 protein [Planctomycetota bacterium]|jgi:UPF0176 protein